METKKVEVKCECHPPAPSVDELLTHLEGVTGIKQEFFAAKNIEPVYPSIFSAKPCPACEGRGWNHYPNGPDDYDQADCVSCKGSGKLTVANN